MENITSFFFFNPDPISNVENKISRDYWALSVWTGIKHLTGLTVE